MKKFVLLFGWWVGTILAGPKSSVPAAMESATPSRVFIVHQPGAYPAFKADPEKIRRMVKTGLESVTGKPDVAGAWRSLVSTQEVVGIKILSAPGPESGTRPAVVAAVIQSLLDAGQPASHIVLWDKRLADLRRAGFFELAARYRIEVAGSFDEGYDEKKFYPSTFLGKLVWGDVDFERKGEGVGRNSFVSKLLTRKITKIVQITPLLNHNLAGVSGNLFSLAMGSVDNTLRFESTERMAQSVPEIYALPDLGDRVVLNIVDALLCQYQGEEEVLLHFSAILNELRFSTDPVALDTLSILEIQQQQSRNPSSARTKSFPTLYANASLLELGQSDLRRIDVIRLEGE